MPVNWDDLASDADKEIDKAVERTDAKLASKISSITRLTDEEIQKLFPEPADVKKLAELMRIVNGAEARNKKINQIVNNSEAFAGIILDLLKKFV
ncbi:MAG: hypothetical protein HY895_23365 [Deltaproteobacteria bacterium]|nr:hypothetical protein [Deltaproteobacteria bacterium]